MTKRLRGSHPAMLLAMSWGLFLCPLVVQAETGTSFSKMVKGTVSAVNKDGIAVEETRADRSSHEMYLPFDSGLKLERLEKVTDVQPGDTVLVEYRETSLKDESGKANRSSRVAVRVSLLTRASKPALVSEPVAAEESHGDPAVK